MPPFHNPEFVYSLKARYNERLLNHNIPLYLHYTTQVFFMSSTTGGCNSQQIVVQWNQRHRGLSVLSRWFAAAAVAVRFYLQFPRPSETPAATSGIPGWGPSGGAPEGSRAGMRRLEGGERMLLRITITLREATVVSNALKEYMENHKDLHYLYRMRLTELEKDIRKSYEIGKRREAEKEAKCRKH